MNFPNSFSPFNTWSPDLEGPKWHLMIQTGVESLDAKIQKVFAGIEFLETDAEHQSMHRHILSLKNELESIEIDALKIKTNITENKEDFILKLKETLKKIKEDDSFPTSKKLHSFDLQNLLFKGPCLDLLILLEEAQDSTPPSYIIDDSTGSPYLNEDPDTIRMKCAALTVGSPLVHLIAPVAIATSHLTSGDYSQLGEDLVRVAMSPLTIVGLGSASLLGLINPLEGRKHYASIESSVYRKAILAPCFQPRPTEHLCGGDIEIQNEW